MIHDSNTSALEVKSDLAKINRWAFQWKMGFNPDPKKQAQEVIFGWKSKAISHPPLVFNNNNVIQTTSQKHLGIILDTRLSFEKHLETVLCKINKTGAIRGSSREKLYQELGFESLQQSRWYRKLCNFCKVFKTVRVIYST